jgi:hypothetical protein
MFRIKKDWLKMLENRVLKKIVYPEEEEVTPGGRKLRNKNEHKTEHVVHKREINLYRIIFGKYQVTQKNQA